MSSIYVISDLFWWLRATRLNTRLVFKVTDDWLIWPKMALTELWSLRLPRNRQKWNTQLDCYCEKRNKIARPRCKVIITQGQHSSTRPPRPWLIECRRWYCDAGRDSGYRSQRTNELVRLAADLDVSVHQGESWTKLFADVVRRVRSEQNC